MQMNVMPTMSPPPRPPVGGHVPASLSEDGFIGGRLTILQPEKGFRAGLDSVFLAASIPANPGESLFEAGIGTGVVALCIASRVPGVHVTGMEVASRYAMLAEENSKRNKLSQSIRVIHGDVKEALRRDLAHLPAHGSFSHAYANPPFHEQDKTTPSPNLLKAQAHSFGPEDLDLWIKVLHTMVTLRGTVTLIYRAEALARILTAMDSRFGDIRVAPLFAREGMAASRVVVQGVKGSKAPMQIYPGLVLHTETNAFTPEAEAILRDGMAWRFR